VNGPLAYPNASRRHIEVTSEIRRTRRSKTADTKKTRPPWPGLLDTKQEDLPIDLHTLLTAGMATRTVANCTPAHR